MKDEAINWIIAKALFPNSRVFVAPAEQGYGIKARVFVEKSHSHQRCDFINDPAWVGVLINAFRVQVEPRVSCSWICSTDAHKGVDFFSQAQDIKLPRSICLAIYGALNPLEDRHIPAELL